MQVFISGKHMDVGSSLSAHIENEVQNSVKKYFEHAISANVTISKFRHSFEAGIVVNDGTGTHQLLRASGNGGDAYAAFDAALIRIEKQLRRYKGKIKNHHKLKIGKDVEVDAILGTKYIISGREEDHEHADAESDVPLIIAEQPSQIETLSVSDAVMRMDLGELPALMFVNKKTGTINVVYRREDGNIAWVDPSAVVDKAA